MKKGFTLVELLAVIVILAVILVIAVPQINNVIKETRKNSLGSTAKLIAAKAEEKEVENDALEKTETITCEDLVKLDSNYGNCRVSKNSTTGKWEVTIVGSGKFSGYTCTGTKDNMSCTERDTNTPEYVYSFERPYYEYNVTDKDACKTYFINEGELEEDAISICNGNVSEAVGITTNEILSYYPSEDISSFAERSNNLYNAPVEDYTELNKNVFIRWPGNTVNFDGNDEKEVCTLYNNKLTCLEGTYSEYEVNKTKLTTLFGSSKCQIDVTSTGEESTPTYTSCTDGSWTCRVNVDGLVRCSAPDTACYIDTYGSVNCSIPNPGITIPDPGTNMCEPVIYPDGSWHCPGE